MRTRLMAPVLCALTVLVVVGCSNDPADDAVSIADDADSRRTLGFDPAELNDAVHPGDDFFAYVNGKWVAENEIPADRSRYGAFDMLRDKSDEDVKAIIERLLPPAMSRAVMSKGWGSLLVISGFRELGCCRHPAVRTLPLRGR